MPDVDAFRGYPLGFSNNVRSTLSWVPCVMILSLDRSAHGASAWFANKIDLKLLLSRYKFIGKPRKCINNKRRWTHSRPSLFETLTSVGPPWGIWSTERDAHIVRDRDSAEQLKTKYANFLHDCRLHKCAFYPP